ncbi:ABC transporter permease [Butyrivibrio sp. MC2013]|uniref:ABC transporter permease n=1 Tax=Butyrivibrio sp. MC2013 TaxID=1280686 RepID=UPI0003F638A7|nr:ABC transporter permease [Butyrivibrio sp. MC2013]
MTLFGKIKSIEIILVVVLWASIFSAIVMSEHLDEVNFLSKICRASFGVSYNELYLEKSDGLQELMNYIDRMDERLSITADDGNERAIYFTGRYVDIPMKEGRFFTKADFDNKYDAVVIGKSLEENSYIKSDGYRYIMISNLEYRVIGIIGIEITTPIDGYIFRNLKCVELGDNQIYTLDYIDSDEGIEITKDIVRCLSNKGIHSKLIIPDSDFENTLISTIITAKWNILLLICCVFVLLAFFAEWADSYKEDMYIFRLSGITINRIISLLQMRYTYAVIIAMLLIMPICIMYFKSQLYKAIVIGLAFELLSVILLPIIVHRFLNLEDYSY